MSAAPATPAPLRTRIRREQTGISLVELVVAIALTAVIATLMVTIVVTVSRSFTREAQATTNSDSASVAMRELSRVIRGAADVSLAGSLPGAAPATAIVSGGAHQLTVHSFIDVDVAAPAPVRVQFGVAPDGTLTETRWAGSASAAAGSVATTQWQFAATAASERVVVRGVPGDAASPLFTYYSAAGTELVLPPTGTLDAAQLSAVAAVTVTLRVQQSLAGAGAGVDGSGTGTGTAALLENTVGLPNLGLSRVRGTP